MQETPGTLGLGLCLLYNMGMRLSPRKVSSLRSVFHRNPLKKNGGFAASVLVPLVRGMVVASPSSFSAFPGTENRTDRQKQTKTGVVLGRSTLTVHLKIAVQKDCGLVLLFVLFSFSFFPWKWRVPSDLVVSKVATNREGLTACNWFLFSCFSHYHRPFGIMGVPRALLSAWGAPRQARLKPSCSSPASTPLHGKG